jgi:hypothetical protein
VEIDVKECWLATRFTNNVRLPEFVE